MAEKCKILSFGKNNATEVEISRNDKLRGNDTTRLRAGEAAARLLMRERIVEVPEVPVFFGDARNDKGLIMPDNHPKIGEHIIVDEKAVDWLVDKGINEPILIDYFSLYINALNYANNSLQKSYSKVRRHLGFEPERWHPSHSTAINALPHRAAATIALVASVDISSDIRRLGLFNQPAHIAAIMNPIEPYEFPQLSSVLQ